jgi:uncharacterized membrane protein SpoIIM required for sporulation
MVFESVLKVREAKRHPWEMFIYAIVITSISLWIAYFIFPSAASVIFLFLITLGSAPMVYKILKGEEVIEEETEDMHIPFYKKHKRVILVYSFLFLGVLATTAFWFSVLPSNYLDIMFSEQITTTNSLGSFSNDASFFRIFFNNLKVATIAFVLSFFYGSGALFILSWNASVIAVFIGKIARETVASISHPLASFYGYAYALPSGLLSISLHGIPEILAYFTAGIAGGILSAGIIKGKKDKLILGDALGIYGFCVVLLIIGSFLEVYVTPNI